MPHSLRRLLAALLFLAPAGAQNLLPDPSVEQVQPPNQFGVPYVQWGGWRFEGDCELRAGKIAHDGEHSAELVGGQGAKVRVYTPTITVPPGTYRFTCWLRGLDLAGGAYRFTNDVAFADDQQYVTLTLPESWGWRKLTWVRAIKGDGPQEIVARVGLWGPGRLWVDDAAIEQVPDDTPVMDEPELGPEEAPLEPPGPLDPAMAVRCADCGYRNMPAWGFCYACGAELAAMAGQDDGLPPVKPLTSFEAGDPRTFAEGTVVAEHATDGDHALRVDRNWSSWDGAISFAGYDLFKVDVYNPSDDPQPFYFEVRDAQTTDYWTRVNYNSVVPPGASTMVIPTDLYVGEKSRPGRLLDKAHITRVVLSLGNGPGPLFFDHVRLEKDLSDNVKVPGLKAFDFGPGKAPPFRGFTAIGPGTLYSAGRGYGLKDARIWRAYDMLQPDPLYATLLCLEQGGLAVDVPNGAWHVWVNIDSPSGFWGEYQIYRQRKVLAEGLPVVEETMDLDQFRQKYFRFWNVEDRPGDDTFDKYQTVYFEPKEFDVVVGDGQLNVEFEGANWANCVSALVAYPADTPEQAALGRRYLDNLQARRRWQFDSYFKKVLPNGRRDAQGMIPDFRPTADEQAKGYAVFARDWMQDVPANGVPRREEVTDRLELFASAGELEPIVFSLYPLQDRGEVTVQASDLSGPNGATIPAASIRMGVVSHRLSRRTMEGTVYTIAPRFVMPRATADVRQGTTTTFWLNLVTPDRIVAGDYTGQLTLAFPDGAKDVIQLAVRLFATPLDRLKVPAGSWGSNIGLPWYAEDLGDYRREMFRKCLAKMREYGCTSFSGMPQIRVTGWQDRQPQIDFSVADQQMTDARELGFRDVVVNYNSVPGVDLYSINQGNMRNAGFSDYGDFLKALTTAIHEHAKSANWLPVAWNLCDEPIGDAIANSVANAKAWRAAAPEDFLLSGATSVTSPLANNPHLALAQALKIADLNTHDEAAINAIHQAGGDWAFYNGGNRWTFGTYLYKCATQYGLKFRLSWHWNAAAGDPFYALDCREDDYSWCVSDPDGNLITSLVFEREIREGIDDCRYLQTLGRLVREHPNSPAAKAGQALIDGKLASFRLGQRNHDVLWPSSEYRTFRRQVAEATEAFAAR